LPLTDKVPPLRLAVQSVVSTSPQRLPAASVATGVGVELGVGVAVALGVGVGAAAVIAAGEAAALAVADGMALDCVPVAAAVSLGVAPGVSVAGLSFPQAETATVRTIATVNGKARLNDFIGLSL
jgi:hypothetical protein